MLLSLFLLPISVSFSFTRAFVASQVARSKSDRFISGATRASRLQRFHQHRMSSSSEWIVSSLSEENNDQASPVKPLIPTHLFLHFDINETILLGDDAGGDSRHESTQKMLAKSAFCQIPASSVRSWEKTQEIKPTHWWDGQEFGQETSMPPLYTGWEWPENCCPYYRTALKKNAKSFTQDGKHGQIYTPLLEACEASLPSKHNISSGNTILPAFYETLRHLIESYQNSSGNGGNEGCDKKDLQAPPFTVVFRTFGSDLSEIASVVSAFAKGEHPDYPDINFPPFCLSEDRLYQGRWKVVEGEEKVVYQLWTSDESQLVASGDAEILELLSSKTKTNEDGVPFSIFGIRDDYPFWKANEFRPTAGKPIWVPRYDGNVKNSDDKDECVPYSHHLLFDDNIHNLPNDGIASVRKESLPDNAGEKEDGTFSFDTVDGTDLTMYQGIHLVRVPTVEPVLNPKWYIQQIEKARNRLQLQLQSQS